jgi:hypothetical protein
VVGVTGELLLLQSVIEICDFYFSVRDPSLRNSDVGYNFTYLHKACPYQPLPRFRHSIEMQN